MVAAINLRTEQACFNEKIKIDTSSALEKRVKSLVLLSFSRQGNKQPQQGAATSHETRSSETQNFRRVHIQVEL